MPADRLINVEVSATGTRTMNGRYVPGDVTVIRTWTTKHDLSLEDLVESGGSRDVITRRWRVRFDSRIYTTPTSHMDVEDGVHFSITHMNEITDQGRNNQTLRRRWIDLTGSAFDMRIWPFGNKLETRNSYYSDVVLAGIVARAQGKTLAIPAATAALESCAGLIGRAFLSCEVSGRDVVAEALTPTTLELMGRSLIRIGQLVMLITTEGGRLVLLPAETFDVSGPPQPDRWEYRLTIGGPTHMQTYDHVQASEVVHIMYAADAAKPWQGNGPIQVAHLAGKLSAETMNALANESSGPVAQLLGIPVDGDDPSVEKLKSDIANAAGRLALLESGDWDEQGGGNVALKPNRIGPNPPEGLVSVADLASREIYGACGISPSMFQISPAAALKESYRIALFNVIAPLGVLVQAELRAKLDASITLGWQELHAHDISGRARAFQQMVVGGMAIDKAVQLAGLLVSDEV